ncbi:asparaginase [Pseudomonas daroniae]|uniref:Asparaginase n=1 Tax=Phytopseudomonas daroniae TaxID=2487519 RepID=A0A4Q9QQV5_9GAMM|nr:MULTISPECIES: asparaginase [Pseudomonas]TBU75550.1 asparaginase [Pseudomonas daroniae]TBU81502.1 asparaginase [Pseudomonas daroniae]TBU84334.1 asparaginase [Pseudomonas sp. FRB 228]TBU89873.1 asparaginase [Pseudomonas daroniae]
MPSLNVLVLYTGGTIGMQMSAAGLAPASGFEARLRAQQTEQSEQVPTWIFRELLPPIDSANMSQDNWLAMVAAIRQGVEQHGCDGVLVLHGTDTLAYSAAALSFLLLGLPVPVLLTGSMLPAGAENSDAWRNLFGAMQALHDGVQPGVHLYFDGALMHGARVSKLRSDAFDAFQIVPRLRQGERLAELPAHIDFRQPRQPVNLLSLPLIPGLRASHLHALLGSGVQGLLLECYGSGTGPSDNTELLEVLREAHARGVVLAAISQCPQGHVEFGVYAAGSQLASVGLVSAGGMTREAALGKLFALLGVGLAQAEVERLFALDLCGECAED